MLSLFIQVSLNDKHLPISIIKTIHYLMNIPISIIKNIHYFMYIPSSIITNIYYLMNIPISIIPLCQQKPVRICKKDWINPIHYCLNSMWNTTTGRSLYIFYFFISPLFNQVG